ncbi:MAG: DUF6471 domain-containing protein [Deferribacterales bacterium]|jgi:hypothetical protein
MLITEEELQVKLKNFLKAELRLRGLTHQSLADLLSKDGQYVTKISIDNKLSRGSFSAAFFFQCIKVLGCDIDDLQKIVKL